MHGAHPHARICHGSENREWQGAQSARHTADRRTKPPALLQGIRLRRKRSEPCLWALARSRQGSPQQNCRNGGIRLRYKMPADPASALQTPAAPPRCLPFRASHRAFPSPRLPACAGRKCHQTGNYRAGSPYPSEKREKPAELQPCHLIARQTETIGNAQTAYPRMTPSSGGTA